MTNKISIPIGGLYGYQDGNTRYGYYLLYLEYDSVERDGLSVIFRGVRVRGVQQGTGYTTNYVYLDAVSINGTDISLSWYGIGQQNPEWTTETKDITLDNIPGDISVLSCEWLGHRSGQQSYAQSDGGSLNIPTVYLPTVSNIQYDSITDTTVNVSFYVISDGGSPVTNYGVQLSDDNFVTIISSSQTFGPYTFGGLTPTKTYQIRGFAYNKLGTVYTNTADVTTVFYAPTEPTNLTISSDTAELTPSSRMVAIWTAGTPITGPVAGYRARIYRNGIEIRQFDIEQPVESYISDVLSTYGFVANDRIKFSLYSYSLDYKGEKHFSWYPATSQELTLLSDKFIYVSENGGEFVKHKIYISVNASEFKEIKKDKLKVIE